MRQLVASLMLFGLAAAACGADGEKSAEDDPRGSADAPGAGTADAPAPGAADAPEAESALHELNVAYYLQWPSPNLVAKADKAYEQALGVPVNWQTFASGGDMAQAMVAGDIDIGYAQGDTPFATFVSQGADLLIVGLPSANPEADNCVVSPGYDITQANAAEALAGQRAYTPLGNVNHYKLLQMLDHLGVDPGSVELVQSEGGAAAVAALKTGEMALVCAFGGAVNEMVEAGGRLLMTGEELEAIGVRIYDVISTSRDFAAAHPEALTKFLQVTIDANRAYNDDPEPLLPVIAEVSGMDLDTTRAFISGFAFPDRDEMLGPDWMGGGVQESMKKQMDFFAAMGEIQASLDSYDQFVDTSFLEAAE